MKSAFEPRGDGYIAKPMRYKDFLAAISAQLART
jgi:hypothetical protein